MVVVLPGDSVAAVGDLPADAVLRVGPGLRRDGNELVATKAGLPRNRKSTVHWLETSQRRYVPAQEETVIGIVTDRIVDAFKVDVGASELATLSAFAFEGATKKNRPELQPGDLVHARLSLANKDMEPELSCLTLENRAGGLGPLEGGLCFAVTLSQARKLLMPENPIIALLSRHMPFEICVGMNGRVWVKAASQKFTVLLANTIRTADSMTLEQTQEMVRTAVQTLQATA